MDYKMLFIRAIKSGCLCSVLYHGFMLITGMAISLRQVVTFNSGLYPCCISCGWFW